MFLLVAVALSFVVGVTSARADADEDCRQRRDLDRRIEGCTKLIKQDTLDPMGRARAYQGRAHAYMGKAAYDQAITDLDQAIRLKPNDNGAYRTRGHAYHFKAEYHRAIVDFDQAIRLNPSDFVAYAYRGDTYREREQYDEAIADFDQAIHLNPSYPTAYLGRGRVYSAKGDKEPAIADFRKTLTLDPSNGFAAGMVTFLTMFPTNHRSMACLPDKDPARAIRGCTEIIQQGRMNAHGLATIYFNRGLARQANGDLDQAIADFDRAITLNPKHAFAYNNRGNSYLAKGDLDRALADHELAVTLLPTHPLPYYSRGSSRRKRGDKEQAIADFRMALSLHPSTKHRQAIADHLSSARRCTLGSSKNSTQRTFSDADDLFRRALGREFRSRASAG